MRPARLLPNRVRHLAPEALAFGVIGAANTLLYMLIVRIFAHIGVVKATVIATVATTTLAYVANRFWTYRHHARSALRREYTLFFAFNLTGLVIQSGSVATAKYGFGLTERNDLHLLLGVTLLGIAIATLFRFWAYRTFVFLKPHPDTPLTGMDNAAGLAEVAAEAHAARVAAAEPDAGDFAEVELEAELAIELDEAEQSTRR